MRHIYKIFFKHKFQEDKEFEFKAENDDKAKEKAKELYFIEMDMGAYDMELYKIGTQIS